MYRCSSLTKDITIGFKGINAHAVATAVPSVSVWGNKENGCVYERDDSERKVRT